MLFSRNRIDNAFINHYAFKSTEEFPYKITRGGVLFGYNKKKILHKIKSYFIHNIITLEKIILIENKTGLKLKQYRKKLNIYML